MLIVELARRVMALLAGESERWHVSSERRNNTTQNRTNAESALGPTAGGSDNLAATSSL